LKDRYGLLGLFLVLSVLLHVLVILAEFIQAWMWVPETKDVELRKTTRKLKTQQLADPVLQALKNVKPAELLTVYLRHALPASTQSDPAHPPAKARKKRHHKAVPVQLASQPEPAPESGQAPVRLAEAASAPVASEVASAPVAVASAPQVVAAASKPAASKPPKPTNTAIARFPSEVKMTFRWGFYIADMTWKVQNGRYDVEVDGSGLGAFYRYFHSTGRLDAEGVHPEHFIEYRERSKTKPEFQLDFDYANRTVEVGETGKRKVEPMGEGDKDVFSAAFHLALLGSAQDEYVMTIYTGRRRYEDVKFSIAGESTLTFGGKDVDVILLRGQWKDRHFDFWLAPEWNNLPVRINVVVPDRISGDLWVQDLTIDGKTVLEWNPPKND
jgi:hypothetical protein